MVNCILGSLCALHAIGSIRAHSPCLSPRRFYAESERGMGNGRWVMGIALPLICSTAPAAMTMARRSRRGARSEGKVCQEKPYKAEGP